MPGDDIDRVLEIARRYDVQVFLSPRFPVGYGEHAHEPGGKNTRGLEQAPLSLEASAGPIWHHCDTAERKVWFDNFDLTAVETHLHEVCHVITQPPSLNIEEMPEDVLLIPFERVLARQCLSRESYRSVVKWQEATDVGWFDGEHFYSTLGEVPNYTYWGHWRQSFKFLRDIGVINKHGRVTWEKPQWDRFSLVRRSYQTPA